MVSSRQLEYFRAVARELHFTRAAASLHVAQPALSQQIRKLERQLGVTLFERDNHRVDLTPAGAALLEHAERILSDLAAVDAELSQWEQGTRGVIRLGAARGLMAQLARLLAAFADAYPAVRVELDEQSTEQMIAGLRAGRLDAATIAALPPLQDGTLASRPLGSEALVLVTSAQTPLTRRRRLPISSLDGADLVLYRPGSAVRDIIVSALSAAGANPRIRFETREYRTARILASAGLAAAILPRTVADEPGPAVRQVKLEPEPRWTPSLAWSATRRPDPALAAFVEFAITHPALTALD